ncbi:hypothetical protein PPYR_11423 [Photinus pyralis]|uniref:Integrin beta n=1 Tax=Photinus pyralis TaxID=7054 RepID=A0A1Y1KLF1_PHOPY|nr:integrin beta-PS isoform X1 [Photinus pyralis]KAB0794584.1 hypothetical protein PPYR_11423 [Photinus pyralis]
MAFPYVPLLKFACLTFLYIVQLNAETFLGINPCISKTNCQECIRTPSCAWCYDPSTEFDHHPRCYQPAGQQPHKKCPKEYQYFPSNYFGIVSQKPLSKHQSSTGHRNTRAAENRTYTSYSETVGDGGTFKTTYTETKTSYGSGNNEFSGSSNQFGDARTSYGTSSGTSSSGGYSTSYGGASGGYSDAHGSYGGSKTTYETTYTETTSESIQITPQRVHMKLRARESFSFTVSYAQAHDYPVDLYYLMDLSKSMEDDKDKLSKLGNMLAESMQSITSQFQLGFGSFVDKVVMPYVSTVQSKLKMPCTNCTAPYGYRNHLPLSNDTTKFARMVKAARVSGNLDAPEGGFDALMQAVVCKQDIGWRDNARRLLVFSTDDGFHSAGDGKLGGIIKPNDGRCHLQDQYYSYSSVQDYPSISQLNLKVKENAINVIFAVTEERREIYNSLKEHIEGASSGTLSADSSNVVQFVRKQYEEISSNVELKDNSSTWVEIKYYSRCGNSDAIENNTKSCGGFKVGEVIDFRLEVFLKECPEDRSKWNQTIQVYPIGLSESVYIDLEMLCSCPCDQAGDAGYKLFAKECNNVGTLKCGICECDPFHQGQHCECSLKSLVNQTFTQGCKQPNVTDVLECSGRGACICNKCECDIPNNPLHRIYGDWCECDNFSCYRHGGVICGGHGICDCGECKCNKPWTGKACDCYNETNICYPPKSNAQECDGHGKCVCGECVCNEAEDGGGKYTGKYCERCPNCTETCEELKPCVLCQMYQMGPYKDNCIEKCSNFTPIEVQTAVPDEKNNEFQCAGYDENNCRYIFVYRKQNETHYIVKAQKERECKGQVLLLGIVFGVIAAVVLMGLAILLLWKLFATIHDRREFARFEKERMMAKWDTGENPIYKQATSTFKNPTYAGKG